MDEKVLEALTIASMLHNAEGGKLSADLMKIHEMLDSAAKSELSQGSMKEDYQVGRFLHSAGLNESENCIVLRSDETRADAANKNITSQSKRYDEPYNAVPRVV